MQRTPEKGALKYFVFVLESCSATRSPSLSLSALHLLVIASACIIGVEMIVCSSSV